VSFDARKDSGNKRLLELINKTNQFNLNGVRLTEESGCAVWKTRRASWSACPMRTSSALGAIGVVAGSEPRGAWKSGRG